MILSSRRWAALGAGSFALAAAAKLLLSTTSSQHALVQSSLETLSSAAAGSPRLHAVLGAPPYTTRWPRVVGRLHHGHDAQLRFALRSDAQVTLLAQPCDAPKMWNISELTVDVPSTGARFVVDHDSLVVMQQTPLPPSSSMTSASTSQGEWMRGLANVGALLSAAVIGWGAFRFVRGGGFYAVRLKRQLCGQAAVVAQLGAPVRAGALQGVCGRDLVNVEVPLVGARGSGVARVQALRRDDRLQYTYAAMQTSGKSSRVKLDLDEAS